MIRRRGHVELLAAVVLDVGDAATRLEVLRLALSAPNPMTTS